MRNITDVDDKINARAAGTYPDRPLNEAIRLVTGATEEQFHADIRALGVLMPEDVNEPGHPPRFIEPRATEHIAEMRMIIERLIERGVAYVAEDHVLFSVAAMRDRPGVPLYGAFSRRSLDELLSGARVDVAPYKRDAMDFVLWKPSGPQDPAWPSPGGIPVPGRPGWHIECSAMAWKHLVAAFETRIACESIRTTARSSTSMAAASISCSRTTRTRSPSRACAFDTARMANVWMHNGFLQVEGEKMSKSLGNFFTIAELLADWPGEVLRLNMLRTHYRQPMDWTIRGLEESSRTLDRWYGIAGDGPARGAASLSGPVADALADDLNTPRMLAELYALDGSGAHAELAGNLGLLGFLSEGAEAWTARRQGNLGIEPSEIEAMLAFRREARAAKNWAESDRIRDALAERGVVVKDNKDGTTTWEVAR